MSKLLSKAKSSKLSGIKNVTTLDDGEVSQAGEESTLIKKYKEYPRSYRFDPETMNILKSTLDRVNEISSKKVSESKLIKALIALSKDIDEMKIIKASKEVW